jgi:hypothetical protein
MNFLKQQIALVIKFGKNHGSGIGDGISEKAGTDIAIFHLNHAHEKSIWKSTVKSDVESLLLCRNREKKKKEAQGEGFLF